MSSQINYNTLIYPTPLVSSSSSTSSGGSVNTTWAESSIPLYFYNGEEKFQQAADEWEEETRDQEMEDFESLFSLQGNSRTEDSEGNGTADTLFGEEVSSSLAVLEWTENLIRVPVFEL